MTDIDMSDFDWEIYLFKYPDLIQQGIRTKQDACRHYKNYGFSENRNCMVPSSFDAEKYIRLYRFLGLKTPKDAYLHYMKIGTFLNKVKKHVNNDLQVDMSIFQQKPKEIFTHRKPKAPEKLHPIKPSTKPKPHFVTHTLVPLSSDNYSVPKPPVIILPRRKPALVPTVLYPLKPKITNMKTIKPVIVEIPPDSQTTTTKPITTLRRRPSIAPISLQPLAPKTNVRKQQIVEIATKVSISPLPQTKPVTLPRRKPLILSKPLKSLLPTTTIDLPVIQPPTPVKKQTPFQNTFKPIRQAQPITRRFGRVYQPSIVKINTSSKKPISPILHSILTMTKRSVRQPKPGQLVLHEAPSSYFAKLGVLGPPKYLN